jgi:hypothetical protein
MQKSAFFEGILQRPVKVGGYDITVPIFYQDITSLGIFLLASLDKVKNILPSKRMNPFRVTPWHCLVTITASEYKESDLGPYNAVSIGIPIIMDKVTPLFTGILHKPPEVPMIYVMYLPVTTDKARITGFEIASYPELLAEISFENGDQWIRCKVDIEGENILTLSGRKINLKPSVRERVYPITLHQDRGLLRSEFNFSECEAGISTKQSDVKLDFGSHPIGLQLKELKVNKVLRYQYWTKQQAILTMACESYMI